MYRRIPFTESERQIIDERPGMMGNGSRPIYNTPVTPRANYDALFDEKHPYWMPNILEMGGLRSQLYNMNLGRGNRADFTDFFGIPWKYEPTAGGSIVVGGNPLLDDANNWKKVIRIPDLDAWDWAAEAAEQTIDPRFPASITLVNGFWFERLISFMDFIPAAMAIIDDEQIDAVKELFGAMTDLACRLVDKLCEYWPQLDCIETHDDWGAQKAPFFSMDTAYELFVPYMKQLTDHIHARGRHALLHSCGHNEDRIQCYIDGGFDMWSPQPMNDIGTLYDNYGDKIVLTVFPQETDLAQRSEAEQRAVARALVDRFSAPGKPVVLGIEAIRRGTPAFEDEIYRYSRAVFLAQD